MRKLTIYKEKTLVRHNFVITRTRARILQNRGWNETPRLMYEWQ